MGTFVIVHGGWGGGWEWAAVARLLRERGHHVYTPTLTGMGERRHLGWDGLGLSDHVEDVLAVLSCEQLQDVVLCGHSYGGMVVTGVADRAPERIRLLVHLDAPTPGDGQALQDLMPGELTEALLSSAQDGAFSIPDDLLPPEGTLPEDVRSNYIARLVPQPVATFTEPARLSGAIDGLPRAFVRCTSDDIMAPFAEQARAEGWVYRELATSHDLQLYDPEGTVAALDELAALTAGVSAPI